MRVILLQDWELMQEYLFHSAKQAVSCHGKARMEQPSVSKWDTNSASARECGAGKVHGNHNVMAESNMQIQKHFIPLVHHS